MTILNVELAQSFAAGLTLTTCQMPGCSHPVGHDETDRFCRWCQEVLDFAVDPQSDDGLSELIGSSQRIRVCDTCDESRQCLLTPDGWECADCRLQL